MKRMKKSKVFLTRFLSAASYLLCATGCVTGAGGHDISELSASQEDELEYIVSVQEEPLPVPELDYGEVHKEPVVDVIEDLAPDVNEPMTDGGSDNPPEAALLQELVVSEADDTVASGAAVVQRKKTQAVQKSDQQNEENSTDKKQQLQNTVELMQEEPESGKDSQTDSVSSVYARVGDVITYPLFESGWVFNGTDPDGPFVIYKGKTAGQKGMVVFSFSVESLGTCNLVFSRYDLSSGSETKLYVPLTVLTPQEFDVMVGTSEAQVENQALEDLFHAGDFEAIVRHFNERLPQSPRERYVLGMSLLETGDKDTAFALLRDLMDSHAQYRLEILPFFVNAALSENDVEMLTLLMKYPEFFDIEHSPEKLFAMGIAAYNNEYIDEGIRVLSRLKARYGYVQYMDEVLWYLASLLERPGKYRNVAEALRLYERILDAYPISKYYEGSEQRIRYLKRHFIDVN